MSSFKKFIIFGIILYVQVRSFDLLLPVYRVLENNVFRLLLFSIGFLFGVIYFNVFLFVVSFLRIKEKESRYFLFKDKESSLWAKKAELVCMGYSLIFLLLSVFEFIFLVAFNKSFMYDLPLSPIVPIVFALTVFLVFVRFMIYSKSNIVSKNNA